MTYLTKLSFSSRQNHLRRFRGEAKTRSGGTVEDDELGFEEDVAPDGEANPSIRLDATKALRTEWSKVDIFARYDGAVRANAEGEVGESGRARESVTALGRVTSVIV
jgi:hypothetical protein